jgi:hypothetical protein
MSNSKLLIRRFDMDMIQPRRTILIIGKRGTGKSVLVKDILYHIRKRVDCGFAITPTQDTVEMFRDCLPDCCIYEEYSEQTVSNIVQTMKNLKKLGKSRDVAFCMDDCMYDKTVMKTEDMRYIHMNGRHDHIWFINSVQYLMDISPALRANIDYVFVLRETVRSNRVKLYNFFFGMFQRFEEFNMVMDKTTNNYECLVLDNTQKSNNLNECLYYYKANPNIGKFRVGRSIFFKLDHMFRKKADQDQNGNQTAKLPDPIVAKSRIQYVEKADEQEPVHNIS